MLQGHIPKFASGAEEEVLVAVLRLRHFQVVFQRHNLRRS